MKSPFAIEKVHGRMVLDSRGIPTIEVEAISGSFVACATAPAGVSKGRFEAHDLRDEDKAFHGMGVQKALRSVNGPINSELREMSAIIQSDVDKALIELDGTPNRSKLGANSMIATSMAVARLGAMVQEKPLYQHIHSLSYANGKSRGPTLPFPLVNVFSGGKHAGNDLPFQEFGIEFPKAKSVSQALQWSSEFVHSLRPILIKKFDVRAVNVGETGGFSIPTGDVRIALDTIMETAKELGIEKQIKVGLSIAGSHIRRKGLYVVEDKPLTYRQLVNYYANLVAQYPISLLEDPFAEDDIQGFQGLVSRIGNTHPIVGDDLLVSNSTRIKRVMDLKASNGLNVKPNQVGTISETLDAIALARDAKWTLVVSDRAGETEDSFIADLAVGTNAHYLKAGSLSRSERVAKYNRLLYIEEELGKKAVMVR
ncbi:MAG: enolase C-terminal domain-like protein [Candidatus Diapherotrites archaeon]